MDSSMISREYSETSLKNWVALECCGLANRLMRGAAERSTTESCTQDQPVTVLMTFTFRALKTSYGLDSPQTVSFTTSLTDGWPAGIAAPAVRFASITSWLKERWTRMLGGC